MRVGVGLPTAVGLLDGPLVAPWSAKAESLGFDSLAVIDRLVAPTYDPLSALAAAAAVTSRVQLITAVLLGPLRPAAVVAAQAATVDRLSGGRLQLGLAVGSRAADYSAAGVAFERRGATLDEQLDYLANCWATDTDFAMPGPVPAQTGGPPILIGGTSVAAMRRVATHGQGWICGLGGAPGVAAGAPAVRQAWAAAGRTGSPRLLSVVNIALGPTGEQDRDRFLRRYYGQAPFLEAMVRDTATTPARLRGLLEAHAEVGCDDILLMPCAAEIGQLEIAAECL